MITKTKRHALVHDYNPQIFLEEYDRLLEEGWVTKGEMIVGPEHDADPDNTVMYFFFTQLFEKGELLKQLEESV